MARNGKASTLPRLKALSSVSSSIAEEEPPLLLKRAICSSTGTCSTADLEGSPAGSFEPKNDSGKGLVRMNSEAFEKGAESGGAI